MIQSERHKKYLALREKYPEFVFAGYDFRCEGSRINIDFSYEVGNEFAFCSSWKVNLGTHAECMANVPGHKNALFNLGMAELISYWKAFCSPTIVSGFQKMTPVQKAWWEKLFRFGLAEFFHVNQIPQPGSELLRFNSPRSADSFDGINRTSDQAYQNDKVLVPVGGGKDSVVGLQILRASGRKAIPFVVNPRGATNEVIKEAGYHNDDCITIERTIDPLLLELNAKGFLNGHTPFSSLLAFATVFVAQKADINEIALSNESSANEATIPGTKINHQYSKSFEFEKDFRHYISNFVDDGIEYFSLLRPLNELQIAERFAREKQFHKAFKSCNVGSKQDTWCCKCPKCLFTFIILSPFLSSESLQNIFGRNLFEDEELVTELEALCGIASEKPFECVGTLDDVNIALAAVIKKYKREHCPLPVLLAHYRKSSMFEAYKDRSMEEYLGTFNDEHFVPKRYLPLVGRS